MKTFVINIGGSSTKVAAYEDERVIVEESIKHSAIDLNSYQEIWEQYDFRKKSVVDFCTKHQLDLDTFDVIVSRGPTIKPVVSGVYEISKKMVDDAKSGEYGIHPCGLGCQMALEFGRSDTMRLTVDPPSVDEMILEARYTGFPGIERKSKFQALNHKAVAKKSYEHTGIPYHKANIVVCHLGSGISIASHKMGSVIDVTNGLDGDAPFGLDRVGTIPVGDLVEVCYSNDLTKEEMLRIINGNGGAKAYLGTNNAIEIEKMIQEGNELASEIYKAMIFQVAKGIGSASAALCAKPDCIILTGGMANSKLFVEILKPYIEWISSVFIMPGEDEMLTLLSRSMDAYYGKEEIKKYYRGVL
jgi:butyrate kinase